MLLSLILSSSLLASPQDFPDINVQYFRPAIDAQHFVWVNESATPNSGSMTFRSFLSYSSRPLIYTSKDGAVTDVLKDLTQLDLVGGYSFGNVRVGIDIPLILNAQGSLPTGDSFSESSIGDLAVDLKYRITRPSSPVGVSVSVRGQFPTSETNAAISASEPMVEGELTVDTKQDKIHVSANIGNREQTDFSYERSVFGSQLYVRGGLGFVQAPQVGGGARKAMVLDAHGAGILPRASDPRQRALRARVHQSGLRVARQPRGRRVRARQAR